MDIKIHSFDKDIAKEVGILPAILFHNINYWCEKNKANEKHYHDGYYWTYNSMKAFQKMFDYASKKQIENALKKLRNEGYLITGNYNKSTYDRTLWYAVKKENCISYKGEMDLDKKGNGFPPEGTPIPNINTDSKPDSKQEKNIKKEKAQIPPNIEDVKAYVIEKGYSVDVEQWYDFYQAKGWFIGKSKMKDWKATIRTWQRNNKPKDKPRNEVLGMLGEYDE